MSSRFTIGDNQVSIVMSLRLVGTSAPPPPIEKPGYVCDYRTTDLSWDRNLESE